MANECYRCEHMRTIPRDAHIRCAKPDPQMTGRADAIRKGWFGYPAHFDPVWKTRDCRNFEEKTAK